MDKQIVHTTSLFEVDDKFNDSRFLKARIYAMHTNINRNQSSFSKEVVLAAKDTFANIPVLADVREYTDTDGNTYLDYSGHSMHIEQDAFDSESERMIYDEKVVGIIPESNDFELVHDDETGNDYVAVTALLYRDYGNYVCDILKEREGKTDVSMEISIDDISYSAEDNAMIVGKMTACAVTLLGATTTPGMAKAHAEVFSSNEDSRQKQLMKIMQELTEALNNYTNTVQTVNSTKGGEEQVNEKLNELLEKYQKTLEDITFEIENLSDEELESAFAEAFTVTDEPKPTTDENFDEDETSGEEASGEEETSATPTSDTTPTSENEDDVNDAEATKVTHSVTYGEVTKEFSVSLSEVIYALSELVNTIYADEETYYGVDVYADDSYIIMQDYMTGRAYKQSYKVKKGSYTLVGDRVPVKSCWLTEDQEHELDKMKSNYSVIETELSEVKSTLAKYESEPEKMDILTSEEYSQISETDEFKSFMEKDTHFDMSVEEVRAEADRQLLAYAKSGKLDFASVNTQSSVGLKQIPQSSNRTSRYGNLFS